MCCFGGKNVNTGITRDVSFIYFSLNPEVSKMKFYFLIYDFPFSPAHQEYTFLTKFSDYLKCNYTNSAPFSIFFANSKNKLIKFARLIFATQG